MSGGRRAGDGPVVDRNVRLARILGLARAGYTPAEIGHVLGLSADHASHECNVALRCQDQIIGMIAGRREWAHVFPGRVAA